MPESERGANLKGDRSVRLAGKSVHPANNASPALEVRGITKRFPRVLANDRISFSVRWGEVHGLLGQNGAGKTTLMNIIFGMHRPDAGEIKVSGRTVEIRSPQHASELGIGMLHQQFSLVPNMSVAENVQLGPSRWPALTRLEELRLRLSDLARSFNFDIEPQSLVEELSVGAQQRVEIIKTLYRGAEILILDEPTAVLTPLEWRNLASFLRAFVADGKAVVFITHKLQELFDVADRCTVLRNGAVVGTVEMSEATKPLLTHMMVGREVTPKLQQRCAALGSPALRVNDLTVDEGGRALLDALTFDVRAGEILGVAGVAGNGQDVLVETLLGLRRATHGHIELLGELVKDVTPKTFRDRGGAVIPEDRRAAGIASLMRIWENLVMDAVGRPTLSRRGFLRLAVAIEQSKQLIREYDIKAAGPDVEMRQLSGGNQQKVVLARELARHPRLLIAAQPTRGLDVAATAFVWERLTAARQAGTAVLLISAELEEIFALSDRIAVIVDGRFLEILDRDAATLEAVGLLMAGEGRYAA